jgi:hypothetical protein
MSANQPNTNPRPVVPPPSNPDDVFKTSVIPLQDLKTDAKEQLIQILQSVRLFHYYQITR